MPQLDNYLFFNGNCAEAMRFYAQTLGGNIEAMMTYAESPDSGQGTGPDKNRIMHSSLTLDGRMLMASDMPPGHTAAPGGFALSLGYDTPAEARRIFEALGAGGSVTMPMAKTFWAEAFGMLTDRFGTPWMVGGGHLKPHA